LKTQHPALDFEKCISFLRKRLQQPLPGTVAQFKLAPPHRGNIDMASLKNYKEGSVMILLFPENNNTQILLIERSDAGRVHAGQIAFPGGKKDSADVDLQFTALRETYEEIGVNISESDVIGQLTQLYIPPSNFLVTPFIACTNSVHVYKKSDSEVKRIITFPLHDLFSETIISKEAKHQTSIGEIRAPAYILHGIKIWGATSMMLSELIELF
jgi:8-oxo-dGTP pyrophosphatase MutT (NUDIX family)